MRVTCSCARARAALPAPPRPAPHHRAPAAPAPPQCCARYVHSNWWKYDPHATPAFHHPIQEAEDERPPIKEGDEGPPW